MSCFSIKTFKCIVWFFSPIEYWRKFIHGWSCSNFHSSSITFKEIWDIDFNKMSMIQWTLSHTSEKPTVGGYPRHPVDFHAERQLISSLPYAYICIKSSVRLWITRFFLIYSVHHMFNTYFQESPKEVRNIEILFIFIIYRANLKKWQHINTLSIH